MIQIVLNTQNILSFQIILNFLNNQNNLKIKPLYASFMSATCGQRPNNVATDNTQTHAKAPIIDPRPRQLKKAKQKSVTIRISTHTLMIDDRLKLLLSGITSAVSSSSSLVVSWLIMTTSTFFVSVAVSLRLRKVP